MMMPRPGLTPRLFLSNPPRNL